jgi:hypothetical protein
MAVKTPRWHAHLLAVALALFAFVPAATAARGPDLAALSVTTPGGGLSAAGGGKIVITVKNVGGTQAARSTVVVSLSADRKFGGGDRPVGFGTVPALKPGAKTTVVVRAMPAQAGSFYVLGCVMSLGGPQGSRANDCATSKALVPVKTGATTPPPPGPALPPNGPNVFPQVTTFEALATTGTIGPAGGVLTAKGFDGSTITFTVPKDALLTSTQLRLVPATATPGPAGVAPLSSVIIEPEGLFVAGATVEFQPPASIPAARLAGVIFGGEDESIVRAPFLKGAALRIDVAILGGYGIGLRTGASAQRTLFASRGCLQTFMATADPCQSESLRKRYNEIMAAGDINNVQATVDAYRAFESGTLLPAIEAAIQSGAQAPELDPMVSIMTSAERTFQLLGVEDPQAGGALQKVAGMMKRVIDNTIDACASGKQGPLLTQNRVMVLARQAALIGVSLPGSVFSDLESKCMTKPYYVTYSLDATAKGSSEFAPWLSAGTAKAFDLPVPAPRAGSSGGGTASASLIFSGLTCNPGGNDSCNFTATSGGLTAQIVKEEWSSKEETRCGRKVKVPFLLITILLKTSPVDSLTTHFCRGGGCVDAPLTNSFDGALLVSTDAGKVELPEAGGSKAISGSGNPQGLQVSGKGSVKVSLRAGG